MNRISIFFFCMLTNILAHAQTNIPPTPSGNVGIGITHVEELTLYVIEVRSENMRVNETLQKVTEELTTHGQAAKEK